MRAWMAVACLVSGAGCQGETGFPGGTGVGNPNCMRPSVARTGGLALQVAEGWLASVAVTPCGKPEVVVTVEQELDLLDAPWLELPGETWCGLTTRWRPPLRIEAEAPSGARLLADVPVVDVSLATSEGGVPLDDAELVLELAAPGWLASEGVPVVGEGDVTVGETSDAAERMAQLVRDGSALFVDDGDGEVSEEERADGPAADGGHDGDDDGYTEGGNPAGR
ncbi:MAG: hypothetical protein KTR31_35900 [Myxococcales bacterium]|nr:hypothetical protein [Myxococcales bacterium]